VTKLAGRTAEEPSRKAFEKYLRESYGEPGEWKKGSEPPDFWLDFRGKSYVVEVTTLLEDFGGKPYRALRPEMGEFERAIKEWFKKIDRAGGWIITFYGNFPCKKSQWVELEKRAKDIISVENVQEGFSTRLILNNRTYGSMMKTFDSEWRIDVTAIPIKWPKSEAQIMIKQALEKKIDRLKSVPQPWILLLWNSGIIVESEDYRPWNAIPKLELFQLIYIVENEHSGFVLYGDMFSGV